MIETALLFVIFIVLWLLGSIIVAIVGSSKTIGWLGYFFIALVLSPPFAALILIADKDKKTEELEKRLIEFLNQQKN